MTYSHLFFGHQWAPNRGVTIRLVQKNGKLKWLVDWRVGGKRFRRFFDSEKEARSFAKRAQEEAVRYGVVLDRLTIRERAKLIEAYELAKEAGLDLLEVVKWAMAQKEPPKPVPTVAEAFHAFLQAKEAAGVRSRYLKQLQWSLGLFCGQFERVRLNELSAEAIEAWLMRQKWGAATRRSVLIDVRSLLNFARQRGWMEENPAEAVETPRWDEKPPVILTVEEGRRLLRYVRDQAPLLLAYLAIGMFAGLRPAELDRLKWEDVWMDRGLIHVTGRVAKTRRRRLVTIVDTLQAWLIICPRQGEGIRPTNFDRMWKRMKRETGVRWGHDILRHSFASYHLAHWRNPGLTAHEMGHADQEMLYRHYRELVTPQDAAAWWSLTPETV